MGQQYLSILLEIFSIVLKNNPHTNLILYFLAIRVNPITHADVQK